MKQNTYCQQFPSEDSPREELDKLLLRVEHRVRDVMRKDGRLRPTLFAVSPEGPSIFAPGPLNEVSEKTSSRPSHGSSVPPKAQSLSSSPLRLGSWNQNRENGWTRMRSPPHHLTAENSSPSAAKLSAAPTNRSFCRSYATIVADSRAWAWPKCCPPRRPRVASLTCFRRSRSRKESELLPRRCSKPKGSFESSGSANTDVCRGIPGRGSTPYRTPVRPHSFTFTPANCRHT